MDQRLKNLEDLSELLTKEMVQQNKCMIETNKNLLVEIKSLRESFVKQDEDFEEFKNLLKKLYDLNKQQGLNQNQMPFMHNGPMQSQQQQFHQQHQQYSSGSSQLPPSLSLNNLNNSYMVDQVNQSMLNNLSFQSERTPLNVNQQNPNASCYSIPSSASAMMMNQQTQFTPYLNNQLPPNQQQQLATVTASQKSTPSFQPGKPAQPQYQPAGNLPGVNLKPLPPSPAVPGMFQPPAQPKPQPQPQQPPVPQISQQPPAKPFSFGNLNKPPVPQNGTDTIKLEQQKQLFNVPPPVNQTTSTPQSSQLFPTSKILSNQEETKPKPPQFQFSPTKQPTETANQPLKPFGQLSTAPPTTVTAPAPSIFGSNLFKSTTPAEKSITTTTSTTTKPLFTLPDSAKTDTPVAGGDEEEGNGANPEEFEPQVDFKPIVKLQEVETKTGEEDDEVLLKHRCKLYRFDLTSKEWKEKGLGDIKFLKNRTTGAIRILMRREHILKICANHRINSSMTIDEISPKQYSWMATDFSDNEPRSECLLAKFKLVEEAIAFKNEFEKAVKASASLSKTNTPVKDTKNETKNVQLSTVASKLVTQPEEGGSKPTNQFTFGAKTSEVSPTKSAFSFGTSQTAAGSQTKTPFSFASSQANATNQPKLDFSTKPSASPSKEGSSLFQNKDMPTFGSLATGKSLFGEFNKTNTSAFSGGIQATGQTVKPLFGNAFQTPPVAAGGADEETAENENPEEYEPQVDFKPIVKLQEVETKTGEENEVVVFKARSKLYRFDNTTKEWKEKGTGEMKVLKHKDHNNMYRILMRRDQVLKICANHRITVDLKFEIQNEKQVRWHAEDYSEGAGKHELLAARFKHESEAKQFLKECETALSVLKNEPHLQKEPQAQVKAPEKDKCAGLKTLLSEKFKSNKWNCDACYAPNNADVVNCACCNTLRPGATEPPKPAENKLAATFGQISFGTKTADSTTSKAAPIVFGSSSTDNKADQKGGAKFEFGSNKTGLFGTQSSTTPLFGNSAPSTGIFGQTAAKTDISSIFGNKSGSSFADLAQKTQPTGFGGGFGSSAMQAKPLFGSTTAATTTTGGETEEPEGDNPEEFIPQGDFKPLVKLNKVETVTGEEDEIVLYNNRCKLFRYNTELKEWREKGLGNIKILKHKVKENHFRVLMRREQIFKLCANHRIIPSLKLENLNEKQLTWYVQDCSEDEPKAEILLAKFRHEEDAKKFKEEFEKAQKHLLENPTAPESPSVVKPKEKLKLNNQKNSSSDNDVIIVSTKEATKDQVEKAKQYQLPENFYLYEHKEKCTGCRGCEDDNK